MIDIEQYEHYQIFADGRVWSKKSKRFLKGDIDRYGYLHYVLYSPRKHFTAHRLVATYFIDNPDNKDEVNHKDGNKLNNVVENLEWVTNNENLSHALISGLRNSKGSSNPSSKLTEEDVVEIKKMLENFQYGDCSRIGKLFNVSHRTISNIKLGKNW